MTDIIPGVGDAVGKETDLFLGHFHGPSLWSLVSNIEDGL